MVVSLNSLPRSKYNLKIGDSPGPGTYNSKSMLVDFIRMVQRLDFEEQKKGSI